MICIYAGVARARTEEDQASSTNQASTPNPVPEVLPEPCFYQQPTECPPISHGECPCKRIVLSHTNPEESAVLCCNLINTRAFEEGLYCASKSRNKKIQSSLKMIIYSSLLKHLI